MNAGDPADNDSQSRRTDIGAIDRDGHDADKFGKFGVDEIFVDGFDPIGPIVTGVVDHVGDHGHCFDGMKMGGCGR